MQIADVGCFGDYQEYLKRRGIEKASSSEYFEALGITDGSTDPLSVEKQLRKALPPEESSDFCHRMVLFGRDVCVARKPKCEECPLKALCNHGKKLK